MKIRLHYNKPIFWIILGVVLANIAVAVYFLTATLTPKGDALLLRVLNSKEPFVTESGNAVKLQAHIMSATNETVSTPDKYALLDLDGDGAKEMVAYISYGEGEYLVFHIYDRKVYGFAFAERDFQNLKADGTFLKSKSTYVNYYHALCFAGTEYQLTELAYENYAKSKARINGQEVTPAEISDYSANFWNKPAVQWTTCTEPVDPMPLYRDFLDGKTTVTYEWQEKSIYYYLHSYSYGNGSYRYAFLDMTGDGSPELCIEKGEKYFFTVKNGELRHWYTEHNVYSKLLSNGALFADTNDDGDYWGKEYAYEILSEHACVATRVTFSWWDGRYVDSSQVHPDRYVFNKQDVTQAEYEEKTKPYLELGSDEIQWQDVPEKPVETDPPETDPPAGSENYDALLLSVLKDETEFIDEAGGRVYLKDHKLFAKLGVTQDIAAVPETYTLVDFDGDGTNELVVYVTPELGAYLVFRVYEGQVYGYEFDVRSMTGLNKDGSFVQSEGAGVNYYVTMCFEGTAYKIFEQAYYNSVDGEYRIGGKYATADQAFEFMQDFSYRVDASWEVWENRPNADSKTLYEAFLNGEKTAVLEDGRQMTIYGYLGNAAKAGFSYTFFDMTRDGVPELCINALPYMYFFTVENGQVCHWYSGYMMYYRLLNNGALLYERHDGAPAYKQYEYYEVDENGEVKLIVTFSWNEAFTIEDVVYPERYLIDGKEVSKAEYEEKVLQYLQIGEDKIVWFERDGNPH